MVLRLGCKTSKFGGAQNKGFTVQGFHSIHGVVVYLLFIDDEKNMLQYSYLFVTFGKTVITYGGTPLRG